MQMGQLTQSALFDIVDLMVGILNSGIVAGYALILGMGFLKYREDVPPCRQAKTAIIFVIGTTTAIMSLMFAVGNKFLIGRAIRHIPVEDYSLKSVDTLLDAIIKGSGKSLFWIFTDDLRITLLLTFALLVMSGVSLVMLYLLRNRQIRTHNIAVVFSLTLILLFMARYHG